MGLKEDVIKNPTKEQIAAIAADSLQKVAKWLKDPDTGNTYYWPSELHEHMEVAVWLKLRCYTKGRVREDGTEITKTTSQHWQTDLER